jgi:hypothetical protein
MVVSVFCFNGIGHYRSHTSFIYPYFSPQVHRNIATLFLQIISRNLDVTAALVVACTSSFANDTGMRLINEMCSVYTLTIPTRLYFVSKIQRPSGLIKNAPSHYKIISIMRDAALLLPANRSQKSNQRVHLKRARLCIRRDNAFNPYTINDRHSDY